MISDMEFALLAIFAVLAVNMGLTLRLYGELIAKPHEMRRSEDEAQAAMNAAAEDVGENGEKDRNGSFDEGFENIMRFAVNGKTGFEGGE